MYGMTLYDMHEATRAITVEETALTCASVSMNGARIMLFQVWAILKEQKVIQKFEEILQQKKLERKGSKSTTKLDCGTEILVQVD